MSRLHEKPWFKQNSQGEQGFREFNELIQTKTKQNCTGSVDLIKIMQVTLL